MNATSTPTQQAPVEEYIVPIDPMDDLQCDSCQ